MRRGRFAATALSGGLLLARAVAGALEIGAVAPDFTMKNLDGGEFSLAEAEKTHDAVVILFMSTICPYSNRYDDLIRDMAAQFGKKVAFVGINSGRLETAQEARDHAREHGQTFDILRDPDARVAKLLDARRTPEAFLLDASGKLRYHGRVASKLSAPDLKLAIEALLEGRAIWPAETKAFGCAIAGR